MKSYIDIKTTRLFLMIKPLNGMKSHLYGCMEISRKNKVKYSQIGMHWISQGLREGILKEVEIDDALGKLHGKKIFKALFKNKPFKGWE